MRELALLQELRITCTVKLAELILTIIFNKVSQGAMEMNAY